MPRPYPAPHPHHPLLIGGVILATLLALLLPTVAAPQDYDGVYEDETTLYYDDGSGYYDAEYERRDGTPHDDGTNDDVYYNSPAYYNAEAGRVPFAGKEVAYDYLSGEYYRYEGQPQQDRRAREQEGYRDGVLHTRPRGYYHRRWYNYYDNGCGCSRRAYYRVYNSWGEHEYRQIYRGAERYDRRRYYGSRDRYDRY